MKSDKPTVYPDISDILARKAAGRRDLARRTFGEKIAAVEALRERVAPLKQLREAKHDQYRLDEK
jgi:hypothetical protein